MPKYTLKAETGKFESRLLKGKKPSKDEVINDLVEALNLSRDMLRGIQINVGKGGHLVTSINEKGLQAIIDLGEQALDKALLVE